MERRGWRRIFVARGRVRSLWRLLAFVALLALLGVGGSIVFAPLLRAAGSALVAQSALVLAAALIAGWIALAWFDGRRPGALGFAWTSHSPRELVGGFGIGAGALGVVVAGLALAGWLDYRPETGSAADYLGALTRDLMVLAVAAAAEEAVFRGYGFQVLVQGIGPVAATVLAAAAFAAAHIGNPNVGGIALVNIFLAGVLLSATYLRSRSLWLATAVHVGWNWAMASAFDLPVSGWEFFDTPLYEPVLGGPDWVTGGAFGPEGGIGASIAFVIALIAVTRLPGLGEAPEMRARRPLIDEGGS
ncbi:MAG TPA: CPBP family intramembrane glutamic endopeptidase [Longimicrobiales bacterium]